MSENRTLKEISGRLTVVYLLLLLFALVITGRVVWLMVMEHDKWSGDNVISQKDIVIEPVRGDICAYDGRILSTSVPSYEIHMDLKTQYLSNEVFNAHIDSLALCLSQLFGDKSASQYKRALVNARYRGSRYYLVRRNVDYLQLKELKTFPLFRLGQYKGGLIVEKENKRVQPFVNLASRTIGYYNKAGTKVGLEGAYNKELSGEKGVRLVQRIAGNYWMPVNDGNEVEPVNGKDIVTTIDVNLQDVAHHALEQQLIKHGASHGTAVLMEVQTGDIKAIVNLKRNDANLCSEVFNYAVAERTEPGSTFKLASLMVALEDGFVDINDSVDTGEGQINYYNHTVTDHHEGGYGKITVKRAFEVSSNVAVSKIITQYYAENEEKFVNRLRRMSLNEPLGVEIKGERAPYIKYPGDTLWSGISLPQMSYGYEVEQTPLQILTFYNAVANDGRMMRPRLVKAIADHGQIVEEIEPEVMNNTICSKQTIEKAKEMLEGVVENGTARNLRSADYKIAGKTGTARIANKKYGYRYQGKMSYQASFVGYFPADDPKYSCIVVVHAPTSGVYYGNQVAGNVFKEIADKVYSTSLDLQSVNREQLAENNFSVPYSKNGYRKEMQEALAYLQVPVGNLGINSDWVATEKQDSVVRFYNRYVENKLVPNVKGMGAKDALYLLENLGLRVQVQGRGVVSQQSVLPGTRYNEGQQIILKLS